ncbi:ribbon-helix-helix domain-containing protein [Euryhalocaulis sp.]|uniref:ribbon-helix-helix domain-containing protein n=1 Tax=Euryhalocaulis sp. TaxID=2744307 RepID=UPI00257C09AA|nr:ribbon-helix-helix domain-containing protein [Euryhalocaulis sp.]
MEKRSLSIAGHRTSIALEPEFWAALDDAAAADGRSMAGLITEIDEGRDPEQGLASAVRVWLLKRTSR